MTEPSAMLDLVTAQHKMIMSLLDKNEALLKALEELVDTSEGDLKLNQEDETAGWWSLKNESAIRGARDLIAKTKGQSLPTETP